MENVKFIDTYGTITDQDDNVICNPIIKLENRFDKNYIIDNYNDYNIHYLSDGTIINLYYFEGKWRLGTKTCFDLTDMVYLNGKTWKQFFDESIAEYRNDFSYERLDKKKSYTIGFQHTEIHPCASRNKVWVYYDDLGFEKLKTVLQPNIKDINVVVNLIESEMLNCSKSINTIESSKKVLLGYVFYPKDPKSGKMTFLYRSRLWNRIKKEAHDKLFKEGPCKLPVNTSEARAFRIYCLCNRKLDKLKDIYQSRHYQNLFSIIDNFFTHKLYTELDTYRKNPKKYEPSKYIPVLQRILGTITTNKHKDSEKYFELINTVSRNYSNYHKLYEMYLLTEAPLLSEAPAGSNSNLLSEAPAGPNDNTLPEVPVNKVADLPQAVEYITKEPKQNSYRVINRNRPPRPQRQFNK